MPPPSARLRRLRPAYSIDSPDMRRAGRELLSLALMDARNHTLHLLSHYEQALGAAALAVPRRAELEPPLWLAGHIGWFAEYWIGRNPQRGLGRLPGATDAAGLDRADGRPLVQPGAGPPWRSAGSWSCPTSSQTKAYLLDTLESTLELLENAVETDDGLYFFRAGAVPRRPARRATGGDGADAGPAAGLALPAGAQSRASRCCCRPRAGCWAWPAPALPSREERGARGRRARVRDRRPAGQLEPVRGVRRRRRLRPAGAVAAAGLGLAGARPGRRAGAGRATWSRSARPGGAGAAARFRQRRAHGGQPERDARELVGGRCLGALGRAPPGDRSGMGDGRPHGRAPRLPLGRRARMDRRHAAALARLCADAWARGTEFDPQPVFGRARVLRGASFATRARLRHPSAAALRCPSATTALLAFAPAPSDCGLGRRALGETVMRP